MPGVRRTRPEARGQGATAHLLRRRVPREGMDPLGQADAKITVAACHGRLS